MTKKAAARCFLLIALTVLLAFGCSTLLATRISEIKDNPRHYDGREVTISGVVTDSANLVVVKTFSVKDDSGEIRIVTKRSLPKKGEKVRVTGRVDQAFSIGSSSYVVIVEKEESR